MVVTRVLARSVWIVLSAVLLAVAGISWATYEDLDEGLRRSRAIGPDAPRSSGGAVNILLLGLTTRLDLDGSELPDRELGRLHAGESDRGGYNANTLMLVHVPGDGSRATALSIPRDTVVDLVGVPGEEPRGKIKEAYGRAKASAEQRLLAEGVVEPAELEHRGREAGRAAQIATVREFLDVPIDHFGELSMISFYRLTRNLGGVEVCLNEATKDRFSGADFAAGRQRLDAAQALAFVRQRHGLAGGDISRTRRQQAYIAAIMHKLRDEGQLASIATVRALVRTAKENIVLDEDWDLLDFARQAPSLTGGNVLYHTLPIADRATVRRIVTELIGTPEGGPTPPTSTPPPEPPTTPPPDPHGIPCVD